MSDATTLDRARGALFGLAIGDALGMPTQSMSRRLIHERYGTIDDFVAGAADQPIAPNMPAGSVTDDTEQAVLVGHLLVAGNGHVDPGALAHELIAWERSMIARGSLDLLGPSTKAALTALQEGRPAEETGRTGTTNGAAMRVAPVGIAHRSGPGLLNAVIESCQVTHNTTIAISGAAAVAAAVSAGVDGADVPSALDAAIEAGHEGERHGNWIAGASIPARLQYLRPLTAGLDNAAFADLVTEVVGTSVASQESVVAALLVADRYADAPVEGLCLAATLGGDTDTVAAIAGAVLGACRGASAFSPHHRDTVSRVNHLELESLADRLVALR
ncbi:MAG: ADP-ribosylglycohydrolase family protein [Cellulomonadaceae bacterium]